MGGGGLIGHLLSRPNPVLSPFAPVIRRTIPPSDGNRAILSSSSSHFLFHTRRVNIWRDTIDAKPIVFECHLPSSFRNDDGPVVVRLIRALSYRIFDQANRFYSYRGESGSSGRRDGWIFSRYIIGKLFEQTRSARGRAVFLSFILSLLSFPCPSFFSFLVFRRRFERIETRDCKRGTRSAAETESLIDGRNIVEIANIGGCSRRLDTGK